MGYRYILTNISNTGDPGHVIIPRIHRGEIRPSHLDYYLDEFTFRFNRRTSKARGLLFYPLMEQAIDCRRLPRKMIVGGQTKHMVDG
jgi:hypothetical protein